MSFHFQPVAVHPDGGADAILAVDDEAPLDHMDDLTVVGDGNGLGCIERPVNVFDIHDAARDANHAAAVDRRDL